MQEIKGDHECNVPNRTIFCKDNFDIMQGINSGCIDLIYLDPPFNKNKTFIAPMKSTAKGASFDDIFKKEKVKDEWIRVIKKQHPVIYDFLLSVKRMGNDYNYYYLIYMTIRLIECHRLLKSTGSLYLHCDPTMSHYLKLVLDCIFGEKNFRNEIVWQYFMGGKPKKDFANKHDIILRYSKSNKWIFNLQRIKRYLDFKPSFKDESKNAQSGKDEIGYWSIVQCPDVWPIKGVFNMSKQYVGYPTQKPIALLERIIKASTNPGDLVLDPFCGCATTCVTAEKLGRNWIGIDVSEEAHRLVLERLNKEVVQSKIAEYYTPRKINYERAVKPRISIPSRSDGGFIPSLKNRSYKEWVKNYLYKVQKKRCIGCCLTDKVIKVKEITDFHIDHIKSQKSMQDDKGNNNKYGTDNIGNLQLLCLTCNSSKNKKDFKAWVDGERLKEGLTPLSDEEFEKKLSEYGL